MHRQLVLDELNKINCTSEATTKELIVFIITAKGTITFSNEDLLIGGPQQNKALYLLWYAFKRLTLTLVDSGSAVDFYP